MKFKAKIKKIVSIIATFAILFNSIAPSATVLAQEFTPEPTPSETTTPTEEPTSEPTASPTEETSPTPEATIVPSDEPSVSPTNEPSTTQAPESNPSTTSPPADSVTPSSSPVATPETPKEVGTITTTIIENVDLSGIVLLNSNLDPIPTVTTDKPDYAPTGVALISGTGFSANKTYTLEISSTDEPPVTFEAEVFTDNEGSFAYTYQLDGNYRPNYVVYVRDGSNIVAEVTFTDSAASLDQCGNDSAPSSHTDGCSASASDWVNGNLGASKSSYFEDDSVPYRMTMTGLSLASHTITFEWDTTKSGKHATDYLTSFDRTVTTANPCLGVAGCAAFTTFPIPVDPNVTTGGVTPIPGNFKLYGGTITGASAYTLTGSYAGDSSTKITVTFTATSANAVLAWGGHIATRAAWGSGNSAIDISGSPYHMRLKDLDGGGGNQDRSLSADAVIFPASITVIKNASPDSDQDFAFTTTGTGLSGFTLDDNGNNLDGTSNTKVFSITDFGSKTIVESAAAGWSLTGLTCSLTGTGSQSTNTGTRTATLNVQEGDIFSCTYTNTLQSAHLTLVKTITNDNGGSAATSAWTLAANGPTNISGVTGNASVTNAEVNGGTYTLSESGGPTGYTGGTYSCVKNGGSAVISNSITLAAGDNATCTVNNNDNAAHLIVIKHVINDNGGTAVASNFSTTISGVTTTTPTAAGVESPGVNNTLTTVGSYSVDEGAHVGYTKTLSADCSGTIALGETKTCTITNDDQQAYITVTKVVNNNHGGTAQPNDFNLTLEGNSVSSGVAVAVNPGTYTAGETLLSGYTFNGFTGNCDSNGDVTVALGESKSCTLTNTDQQSYVIVNKTVVNDNGGTKVANDFLLTVDGNAVSDEVAYAVNPGTHTAGETVLSGYAAGLWGGDCNENGSVNVALGQTKTCTITNNDIAPQLTLVKQVQNNNGGNNAATDWTLTANGPTTISGAGGATSSAAFSAGTYVLSESVGPNGYIPGNWNCTGTGSQDGSSITLANGQSATCTIINDDVPAQIILTKVVNNIYGGGAGVNDFGLTIGATGVTSGQVLSVNSNTSFALNEAGLFGYEFVSITGDALCPAILGGTVTLNEGGSISCTITNRDIQPQLTVIKHVVKDNGGTAVAGDFTMNVTGTNVSDNSFPGSENGTTVTLNVGSYSVDESLFGGYTKSLGSDCSGTIAVGEHKTCTITNDDDPGTLIVKKVVINDNGGQSEASDFAFSVDGDDAITFDAVDATHGQNELTVDSGTYNISEPEVKGYATTYDNCSQVFVPNGGSATCTITNDDIAPTLKLVKNVNNEEGGEAVAGDWTLNAQGGEDGFSDEGDSETFHTVTAGQSYVLSESEGPADYTQGSWSCNNEVSVNDNQISLGLAENVTCSVTNTFVARYSLNITKSNNAGSSISAGNNVTYTLNVKNDSNTTLSNLIIKDTLPGGFSYISGTTTGDLTSDPTINGNNLTWNAGTVLAGATVNISYQVKTNSNLSDGTYFNIATCSALSRREDQIDCNTANSQVNIGHGSSFGGNLVGQVLGASTELPDTGSPTGLLILALGLLGTGFIIKKKYAKN